MTTRQPLSNRSLPLLWLLSDERNDMHLEDALAALPRGSGFVFRHYHLEDDERRARYEELTVIARNHDHCVILSSDGWNILDEWGGDGLYTGSAGHSGPPSPKYLWLASAHNGDEVQAANRAMADGIFLSPVFPTRSHPGGSTLGIAGFNLLAQQSAAPVIALGGMTAKRAALLDWPRWGAIDGLA